ncbi:MULTISPECIES: LPXTG cell wall anchor domain-containing protein [Saccharibacillus]|uniref:LPXTG cell wall anchor domain-containing protein n=1 Tax=Saccharibacillus TaxID=456492 RepID=UPI00123B98E3|nr:LPXTG cell wall anchor domain-containing protein [Saccharibacillus sp. WB 17]MWJ33546.1 LPXTG cell wall anchor domain-containing protein [Saccharibacillus sp. WB 17]
MKKTVKALWTTGFAAALLAATQGQVSAEETAIPVHAESRTDSQSLLNLNTDDLIGETLHVGVLESAQTAASAAPPTSGETTSQDYDALVNVNLDEVLGESVHVGVLESEEATTTSGATGTNGSTGTTGGNATGTTTTSEKNADALVNVDLDEVLGESVHVGVLENEEATTTSGATGTNGTTGGSTTGTTVTNNGALIDLDLDEVLGESVHVGVLESEEATTTSGATGTNGSTGTTGGSATGTTTTASEKNADALVNVNLDEVLGESVHVGVLENEEATTTSGATGTNGSTGTTGGNATGTTTTSEKNADALVNVDLDEVLGESVHVGVLESEEATTTSEATGTNGTTGGSTTGTTVTNNGALIDLDLDEVLGENVHVGVLENSSSTTTSGTAPNQPAASGNSGSLINLNLDEVLGSEVGLTVLENGSSANSNGTSQNSSLLDLNLDGLLPGVQVSVLPSSSSTTNEPGTDNGGNTGGTTPGTDNGGNTGGTTPGTDNGGNTGGTTPDTDNGGNTGGTTPDTGTDVTTPSSGEVVIDGSLIVPGTVIAASGTTPAAEPAQTEPESSTGSVVTPVTASEGDEFDVLAPDAEVAQAEPADFVTEGTLVTADASNADRAGMPERTSLVTAAALTNPASISGSMDAGAADAGAGGAASSALAESAMAGGSGMSELPQTGESGDMAYAYAGLLLIACGALMGRRRSR